MSLSLVEVPLRRPGVARAAAAFAGVLLLAAAMTTLWAATGWAASLGAAVVTLVGGALLRVASLPNGWIRVTADRLVIRTGALRRPVVIAREDVRAVAVGDHAAGATSAGVARRQLRRAERGTPVRWGPQDLTALIPVLDAHVRLEPPDANVAVLLRRPVPAPEARWSTYLAGLLFPPLTERAWRPGGLHRVLLLRAADPDAARAALADWPVQPDLDPLAVADDVPPLLPVSLRTAMAAGMAMALIGGAIGDLSGLRPAAAVGACDTARGMVGQALDRQDETDGQHPVDDLVPLELMLPGGAATFFGERQLSAAVLAQTHPAGHGILEGLERWGLLQAYERRWLAPSGGAITVAVQSFAMPDGAHDYHVYSALRTCEQALETFDVPGLERATAMRLPGVHSTVDEVAFVIGAHRFVVTTDATEPPDTLQHVLAELRAEVLTEGL